MGSKVLGYYDVPFIGQIAAFNYEDVVVQASLALNDVNQSYVYILRRPDTTYEEAPSPFYIGVGSDRRFAFHYLEAAGTGSYKKYLRNAHKSNTISKVGRNKVIIQLFNVEDYDSALQLEKRLISYYGRRNDKTGILTNLTAGGEGVKGIPMPEHVAKILRERALNPIKFNFKKFEGIKTAFDQYSADELANILSKALDTDKEELRHKGYCNDYSCFKAIYSRWSQLGYFPEGFNYLNENTGAELYPEKKQEEIANLKAINQEAAYQKAWNTRYSYRKYRVPKGDYYTIKDAADAMAVPASNLAPKFRIMAERDHFECGYNILDDDGQPLYQERDISLQQLARSISSAHLTEMNSVSIMVYGVLVPSITEAYQLYEYARGSYYNFAAQIKRYKEFGAFPKGLNLPESEGGPFIEVEPELLLGTGRFESYYKVCGKLFTSMQSASISLGLPRKNSLASYFDRMKKRFKESQEPFPFGFNIYETKTGEPVYPEHEKVCDNTPFSGLIYEGRYYKNYAEAEKGAGKKRGTVSAYFKKRKRRFFTEATGFDAGMNIFGLDNKPLYPLVIGDNLSKSIMTTTGRSVRHNTAKTIQVKHNNDWVSYTPITRAWYEVTWIKNKYKNPESFYSTMSTLNKKGKLPEGVRFIE